MLITYDVKDTQILVIAPAVSEEESSFNCEVPEKVVQDYLSALEVFKNASAALERAIG